MKVKFIFCALITALVFTSCVTNKDNVWNLLAQGDERAKGYFLGKVDVHDTDDMGRTPLHYAAQAEDPLLASFFISQGAVVDALDNENQSPLSISAEKEDPAVARVLATAGANIHLPGKNGESPAQTAIRLNGSFLDSIINQKTLPMADGEGRTILHLASIGGNTEAVQAILDRASLTPEASPIDQQDLEGKNALDAALSRTDSQKHYEVAELLILAGAKSDDPTYPYFAPAVRSANYNARRADGVTPMHYAARQGYEGLANFLFEKKADVNIKNTSGTSPLHEAAGAGHIRLIQMLLDKGAEVNTQDAKGNSVLHMGIPADVAKDIIKLFLQKGANPNTRDEHGETPLHILVTLNRTPDIVEVLLIGGADVSLRNIEGKTPLYLAVQEDRVSLIPLFLDAGANVFAADNAGLTPFDRAMDSNGEALNALITAQTVHQSDSAGNTMLHAAITNRGEPDLIARILDKKALVNARNKMGDTALHFAVRLNQQENGELLITRGADIFAPNSAGESPLFLAFNLPELRRWMINPQTVVARDGLGNTILHYAAQWKMDEHIPFVIQSGVPIESINATGETPLFTAVKYNGTSTIRTLLAAKANLNARDSLGNSVLHAAVRWNSADAANVLLESGIDINAHSFIGKTPLHDSIRLGITGMETLLTKGGADLESRDADGNTPLMEAVMAGFPGPIERLTALGAEAMTRNTIGDTPLHAAVAMERFDLVSQLLRLGVSIHARNTRGRTPYQLSLDISPRMVYTLLTKDRINVPDDFGNSPLHIAIQEKAPAAIIKVIVEQGCRLNSVDFNGRTPLRLAATLNYWEIARLLADSGSDPFTLASDGKTPAEIALSGGSEGIRALFSGKAMTARDASGNTVLHYAARYGKPENISLLLELGASKSIKNIASESPLDVAVRWNLRENAALLN